MVRAARSKIKLNKPIAVGFTILEISKLIMYDFYYGYLKNKYQDRISLLFTDTDSLCCEIRTPDLYRDMAENLESFDTSNFETDNASTNFRQIQIGDWVDGAKEICGASG